MAATLRGWVIELERVKRNECSHMIIRIYNRLIPLNAKAYYGNKKFNKEESTHPKTEPNNPVTYSSTITRHVS